jgi:hypothetical protein
LSAFWYAVHAVNPISTDKFNQNPQNAYVIFEILFWTRIGISLVCVKTVLCCNTVRENLWHCLSTPSRATHIWVVDSNWR